MDSGRKEGVQDSNKELAKELADVIHYTVAIAKLSAQPYRPNEDYFEKTRRQPSSISMNKFGRLLAKEHLRKILERDKIKPKNVK